MIGINYPVILLKHQTYGHLNQNLIYIGKNIDLIMYSLLHLSWFYKTYVFSYSQNFNNNNNNKVLSYVAFQEPNKSLDPANNWTQTKA